MPVIASRYKAPRLLKNPHLHTIACASMRRRPRIPYIRERLELRDGDFLDLDWSEVNSKKLVILTHGMEGSSNSKYILHTVRAANDGGYSAVAWNMRGCSGEINRKLHFYHSGKSEDLHAVVRHAIALGYREIFLAGFSLGGNLTLVYLGREGKNLHRAVKSAVAISAPIDLAASGTVIEAVKNRLYLKRFLADFEKKFKIKRQRRRVYIDLRNFRRDIKSLALLDRKYTAPWNGFLTEVDYYAKSSALPVLKNIAIPFLLLNPRDDTFLSPECYPDELASKMANFHFESPATGGHCAMLDNMKFRESYMERRILEFFGD